MNGIQVESRLHTLEEFASDLRLQAERPIRADELNRLMYESDVNWEFTTTTLYGLQRVLGTRQNEVSDEIMEKLDLKDYQGEGRVVGSRIGKLAILTKDPANYGDASMIFGIEQDILKATYSVTGSIEKPKPKGLRMTEAQSAVVRHMAMPLDDIAEKLDISLGSVMSRLNSLLARNEISRLDLLKMGYKQNLIDVSGISETDVNMLPAGQKDFLAGIGIAEKRTSKKWQDVNDALGSKDKHESLLMAIRDKVIPD